jgi:hypothetical protein
VVVVRKNISVQKGEKVLFEDIKYSFYLTNHTNYRTEEIVALANGRCEQENVIRTAQKRSQCYAHAGGRSAQ